MITHTIETNGYKLWLTDESLEQHFGCYDLLSMQGKMEFAYVLLRIKVNRLMEGEGKE